MDEGLREAFQRINVVTPKPFTPRRRPQLEAVLKAEQIDEPFRVPGSKLCKRWRM